MLAVVNEILKIKKGQRFIIGIDGLSRSGKTTLVQKLSKQLEKENTEVCVFHLDDFIVDKKHRYHTSNEEWYEYYHLQWDVEWLKENLFQMLRSSTVLQLPFYDSVNDSHELRRYIIPETCYILIEGVFLQRKEWKRFFDYTIFLQSSREKRFKRESPMTQRNMEKFKKRYWQAEEYYVKTESPERQADLVLFN